MMDNKKALAEQFHAYRLLNHVNRYQTVMEKFPNKAVLQRELDLILGETATALSESTDEKHSPLAAAISEKVKVITIDAICDDATEEEIADAIEAQKERFLDRVIENHGPELLRKLTSLH